MVQCNISFKIQMKVAWNLKGAKGPAWCLQYCSTAWFPEGILHRTVPVAGLDFWFWLDWAILPCWKFNDIKCLAGVYHAMSQGTFQLWLQGLCSLVRWSVLQFDSVKASLRKSQNTVSCSCWCWDFEGTLQCGGLIHQPRRSTWKPNFLDDMSKSPGIRIIQHTSIWYHIGHGQCYELSKRLAGNLFHFNTKVIPCDLLHGS